MTSPVLNVLRIPFQLRDRHGVVTVSLARNEDPEELGHPLIAVGYERDMFVGFPAVTASISYQGEGVRAFMGWVQVIERHDADGTIRADVDRLPTVFGEGCPLYSFGYCPTFADYPANPQHPDGDWVADAFLVAIPDVARSRVLDPVAGFRWGYRLAGSRPVKLFQPEPVGMEAWRHHARTLQVACPVWTFRAR